MTITKKTDIIRQNERDYLNINSENRLIAKMLGTSAEESHSFNSMFASNFDKDTVKEMEGTYWLRVTASDGRTYSDDVTIATL